VVQPFDYALDARSPLDAIQNGVAFGQRQRMGEQNMQLAAADEARAQEAFGMQRTLFDQSQADRAAAMEAQMAMNADLATLAERVAAGEVSANDFAAIATKYPDMADQLSKTWEGVATERKDADVAELFKGVTAIKAGRPDLAIQMLEERAVAAENAGDKMEADIASATAEAIKADPAAGLTSLGLLLQVADPDAAKTVFGEAPEPTAEMREYEFARSQGYQGTFQDWTLDGKKAGAAVTNINTGSEVGTIPSGFELFTDPATGARFMRPIPGGPEDTTKTDVAKAEGEAQKASIIRNNVAELRATLKGGGIFDLPETGIVGERLARWGVNQEAVDVEQKLATLQSAIAFDQLQKMREASPTGGALGAVSERELLLLQSSVGALSNITSDTELLKTLDTIDQIMAKFEAYPQVAGPGSPPPAGAFDPAEIDSLMQGP
jgi:hypothetical protein